MKRFALAFVLTCLLAPATTLLAEDAAAPTSAPLSLDQLAAQIFVADAQPAPAEALPELDLGLSNKSHCTGGACAVWICTCQEDCAPCGIKKVACATGTCICNPPC